MIAREETVSSERVFTGKIFNVRVDKVILPDGRETTREIVEHRGAVGIVAVDQNEMVYMVRQYRKPVEEVLLEIPAGKLEAGEEPLECAQRELLEETGLVAQSLEKLFVYYTTPGFTSEAIHIFVARGLDMREASPDVGEFLEVVRIPLDEAYSKILSGEIRDGKSIAALQHLLLARRAGR